MKKKIAYIIITAAIALTAFSIGRYTNGHDNINLNTVVDYVQTNEGIILHTVDKNGLSCTIDDTTITNTAKTFTGSYNLYLFAGNTGGSMSEPASVKIYSCQVYDNDVLVRDYIPAKLSDGTVGLYDKLNGLLYINAGTGTFISGGYALNLPVNIGGTWKNANEVFVNISGTWKTVESAFVNIGGTWKELG